MAHRHLYCSKCIDKYLVLYRQTKNLYFHCWQQVMAVKKISNLDVLCRCGNCGYEYVSRSREARAQIVGTEIKVNSSMKGKLKNEWI